MTQASPHAGEPGYWLPEDDYEQIRTAHATAETLVDFLAAIEAGRVELGVSGLRDMLSSGILKNLTFNPLDAFPCPRPHRSDLEERVDQGIRAVLGSDLAKPTSRPQPLR